MSIDYKKLLENIIPDTKMNVFLEQFSLMEIAEDEISNAEFRCPAEMWDYIYHMSFLVLRPRIKMTPALYRGHCKQLLDRMIAGQDTRPGTYAEMLMGMAEASLKAPFNQGGYYIYFWLFDKCGFDAPAETEIPRPPWDGYLQEELPAMERKFSVNDRKSVKFDPSINDWRAYKHTLTNN